MSLILISDRMLGVVQSFIFVVVFLLIIVTLAAVFSPDSNE